MKAAVLAVVVCFASLSFANNLNVIPIAGSGEDGFATTEGDFSIQGTGINLSQGLPDGPSFIGSCAVGAVCSFSFTTPSSAGFCMYCLGYSQGMLGNKTADFLDPNLTFSGSALYTGGSTFTMPMTVSGTIIGYQLVCNSFGCVLGPKEFTVNISGKGIGTLVMVAPGSNVIEGITVNFSGAATVTPEPISLVLTGTGLVGILAKKRMMRSKPV